MAIKSIVSRRLVKDHMYANDLQPHTMDISNALKLCELSTTEISNNKKKDSNDNQKQISVSEMKDIKSESELLLKTCKMLDEEFVTCVEKAEKENNMSLVTKG